MKLEKQIFVLGLTILLAAGCVPSSAPLTKTRYQEILSATMCETVENLNADGKLKDPTALTDGLARALEQKLALEKISLESWNATERKYFTAEKRGQLIKLYFTNCLLGLNE